MVSANAYQKRKQELLNSAKINSDNRELYAKFLSFMEYKLQRQRGLRSNDKGNILTLYGYLDKLININTWFKNKPLKKVTKHEIKQVYDGLEDGKILNRRGKPFSNSSRKDYYNKIFKSRLFQMAGLQETSREVLSYGTGTVTAEVRFITEEQFRKLPEAAIKPEHKALLWLAFDIGENINSLLRLERRDFYLKVNEDSKMQEYHINLRPEILKRSRKSRVEPTNYRETSHWLSTLLNQQRKCLKYERGQHGQSPSTKKICSQCNGTGSTAWQDTDRVFQMDYGAAKKFLTRAASIQEVKCTPSNQICTWKDLRSSMACDLLSKNWTTDEVNARLGHVPSSSEIDKYVNFLSLDRRKPQRKVYESNLAKLQAELEESRQREQITKRRIESINESQKQMQEQLIKLVYEQERRKRQPR